ncbi:sugar ABC transporter substrate-binding protein [Geochorda subterranea]|uniref:Sugar ABC transporter substrate-binding protein n=1 Tax=Geochorda subterranea TaxID=3109564 RepID=A0ABZ1BQ70_9FIRM|nr:sugar ABC transporter substrate-binding protein [Limnochorda sp. LNt]WRP14730.1 sugar ABC transporter substrate-binding protein [Limnochorda sp. LNt]
MRQGRAIWAMLLLAAILALAFPGFVAIAAGVEVGLAVANLGATSQARVAVEFEKVASSKGWTVITTNAAGSWSTFTSQMENLVSRRVRAIVVAMADLPSIQPAIDSALRANIPVVAIDSGYVPGIVVNITMNNFVAGAKVAQYLVDRLGGEGNVILFKFQQHFGTRQRGKIMDTVLTEYPRIKVLAQHELPPAGFVQDAQAAMENFLARYGDRIDAVFAPWDDPAAAIAQAIMAAGYKRDHMFVVGIDGTRQAYDMIRAGTPFVATIAQPLEAYADEAVRIVEELVVHGKTKEQVTGGVPTIYLDAPLITPANVPR